MYQDGCSGHAWMGAHLEAGALHEVSEVLVAFRAGLALLACAQRACRAVRGRLGSVLGLEATLAKLVATGGVYGRSEYQLAHAAAALGQAPQNL